MRFLCSVDIGDFLTGVSCIVALIVPFIMNHLDKVRKVRENDYDVFCNMLSSHCSLYVESFYVCKSESNVFDIELFSDIFFSHFYLYLKFRSIFYDSSLVEFFKLDSWFSKFLFQYFREFVELNRDDFLNVLKIERTLLTKLNQKFGYALDGYFFDVSLDGFKN